MDVTGVISLHDAYREVYLRGGKKTKQKQSSLSWCFFVCFYFLSVKCNLPSDLVTSKANFIEMKSCIFPFPHRLWMLHIAKLDQVPYAIVVLSRCRITLQSPLQACWHPTAFAMFTLLSVDAIQAYVSVLLSRVISLSLADLSLLTLHISQILFIYSMLLWLW